AASAGAFEAGGEAQADRARAANTAIRIFMSRPSLSIRSRFDGITAQSENCSDFAAWYLSIRLILQAHDEAIRQRPIQSLWKGLSLHFGY
ncbi:hypothetical protein ACV33Y_31680, partial [Pseudomonas aeruginosa]|uniref:hypothetical protein n=1 Tax=Pseudomonas aeruginosa TaxID=287 RepID=UPI001ED9B69B